MAPFPGTNGPQDSQTSVLTSVTVERRVLLHLLEWQGEDEAFEVDFSLSQAGLAQAIGVVRPAAARELIKLVKEGLVSERTAHVKGSRRQRKVYALTEEGQTASRELRENLLASRVRVLDLSLLGEQAREVVIAGTTDLFELRRLMPVLHQQGYKKGLARLLSGLKEGRLELGPIMGKVEQTAPLHSLERTRSLPAPRYFYGRQEELETLMGALISHRVRAVVITGMAGIGKTTLLARVAHEETLNRPLFHFQAGPWRGSRSFVVALGEMLAREGHPKLQTALQKGENMASLLEALRQDLQDTTLLMLIDDAHHLDAEFTGLLKELLELLEGTPRVHLVVAGRKVEPFYDRRQVRLEGTVRELGLEGLEESASRELLTRTQEGLKVEEEDLQMLLELTRGHPLALELVDPTATFKGSGLLGALDDFTTFIEEEVYHGLSPAELAVLKVAVVYRNPVPRAALVPQPLQETENPPDTKATDPLADQRTMEAVDGLRAKSLLLEKEGLFLVHDALKEFFLGRSTPLERQQYHAAAATYFGRLYQGLEEAPASSWLEERAGLETAHHLLEAEAISEGAELLLEVGAELIHQGTVEVAELLERVPESLVEPETWRELLELKGDAAALLGDLDLALTHYGADLAQTEEGTPAQAQVLAKMGAVEAQRGEVDQALRLQDESLAIFRAHDDALGVARTLNERGLALKRAGDLEAAEKAYLQAVEALERQKHSTSTQDHAALAATLWCNLGGLYQAMGSTKQALSAFSRSYELAAVGSNREVLMEASLARGELLSLTQNSELCLEALDRAWQLAQEGGSLQQVRVMVALLEATRGKWAEGHQRRSLGLATQVLEPLSVPQETTSRPWSRLSLTRSPLPRSPLEEISPQLNRLANLLETTAQELCGPVPKGGEQISERPLARGLLEQLGLTLERIELPHSGGRILVTLAQGDWQMGEVELARQTLERARDMFKAGDEHAGEAVACYQLGLLLAQQKELPRAREMLEQSLSLSQRAGLKQGVAAARQAMKDLSGL